MLLVVALCHILAAVTAHEMRTPITMKGFPRDLLLLSLSAWPVGCFITYTSSTAQQQLRPAGGGRCVNRPLQQKHQQQRLQLTRNRGTLEACPCPPSKAVDASLVGLRGQRRLSETSIGESAARMTRLRQVSWLTFCFKLLSGVALSCLFHCYTWDRATLTGWYRTVV